MDTEHRPAGDGDELQPAERALLRLAGRRARSEDATRARVLARASAAWERQQAYRRRRWRLRLGVAASVVLAALLSVLFVLEAGRAPTGAPVAHVLQIEALRGQVAVTASGSRSQRRLGQGDRLVPGDWVSSGPESSLALRNALGLRIRLASDSMVGLQADGSYVLREGSIYFDTDHVLDPSAKRLRLQVGEATVENLGTRFSVRAAPGALEISVRSGSVVWSEGPDRASVHARERLAVDARRAITRTTLGDPDVEFGWTLSAAAFPPQGSALRTVVDWYADETGRTLQLGAGVERALAQAIRGDSSSREPRQRLTVLLAAAGVSMQESGGVLELSCDPPGACL